MLQDYTHLNVMLKQEKILFKEIENRLNLSNVYQDLKKYKNKKTNNKMSWWKLIVKQNSYQLIGG